MATSPTDEPTDSAADQDLVFLDDLTGLQNRRYLAALFERDWAELVRERGNVTLLMLDLDGFKAVNDHYGHLTGDRVLEDIAGILRRSFRENDRVVRYGGDEFVVVLPGVDPGEARVLAERARSAVDSHPFRSHPEEEPIEGEVSFSVGVASGPHDGASGEEVLAEADRRLFVEKRERRAGRSRRGRRVAAPRPWRASALVLGLLLVFGLVGARVWWNAAAPMVDVGVSSPSPTLLAQRARERQALLAELDSLQEKVGSLLEELEAERSRPRREELAEELAAVRDRLGELEAVTEEADASADSGLAGFLPEPVVDLETESDPVPAAQTPARSPRGNEAVVDAAVSDPGPGEAPEPLTTLPESQRPRAEARQSVAAEMEARPPRLRESLRTRYPAVARHLRREATVRLRVTVDENGTVIAAEAVSGPAAFGFRSAALEAVRDARFEPARIGDRTVVQETEVVVQFRLRSPEESG